MRGELNNAIPVARHTSGVTVPCPPRMVLIMMFLVSMLGFRVPQRPSLRARGYSRDHHRAADLEMPPGQLLAEPVGAVPAGGTGSGSWVVSRLSALAAARLPLSADHRTDFKLHDLMGQPAQSFPQGISFWLPLVFAQKPEKCHPEGSGHR